MRQNSALLQERLQGRRGMNGEERCQKEKEDIERKIEECQGEDEVQRKEEKYRKKTI